MEYSPAELVQKWEEFFNDYDYAGRITSIAFAYPEGRSLRVPFAEINRFSVEFLVYFLDHPQTCLVAGEEAITRMAPPGDEPIRIHLRVTGVPKNECVPIREIRARHLGRFVSVEGLVRRVTEVRPKIVDATFQCLRCGAVIKETQEGQAFREPMECYPDQGGCGRTAASTKFKLLGEASQYLDTQKIEIQEIPEDVRGGAEPQRLTGWMEDDITGDIQPGDHVILNGILRSAQKGRPGAKSTIFDVFLEVVEVQTQSREFEEVDVSPGDVERIETFAREPDPSGSIVRSVAPSLAGLEREKEALALCLFGGVAKELPDGRRTRGDIHILLCGDPGLAKSELLVWMKNVAPRAILASGKGTSAAGLTAAAVRDEFGEGRWVLEAGVMVLADKGIAIIDELDKMDEEDRGAMLHAMEQQRVPVAKAGITALLPSRCSVLAAANPKFGRFVTGKYLGDQVALEAPLLSRFDAIFLLLDFPQKERDGAIARHMLDAHRLGGAMAAGAEVDPAARAVLTPEVEPEFLRKYVAYAKRIVPVVGPEAAGMIESAYVELRQLGEAGTVSATPRQLDGLVRFSEASARTRLSRTVQELDVKRAVSVMRYWLESISGTGERGGPIDIDIVATGVPASQRDQIVRLRDIIQELGGSETGPGAQWADILSLAEVRGIPRDRAEAWLRKWKQEGDLYEPTNGIFRLITRL